MHNKIIRAINFASAAHKDQVRKGTGEPYIIHPVRVFLIIQESGFMGYQLETQIAALLHDVIEDTTYSKVDIHAHFGNDVADLVQELTNVYEKSAYPDLNRKERKRLEFERIAGISQRAKLIKLADRIDNLTERGLNGGFMRKYLKESRDLLEVLRGTDEFLEERLDKLISDGMMEE